MTTLRAALVGKDIQQSRSPALHRAAAASVGMEALYELVDVASDSLPDTWEQLVSAGLNGWNVTSPHKRAAWSWVPRSTSLAMRLEAVNTVVIDADGSIMGHNTDVAGFQSLLGDWHGQRAIVLGAGGAAAAVVEVLASHSAELEIFNRSQARAGQLRDRLAPEARIYSVDQLVERLAGADLLVNAIGPGIAEILPGLDLTTLASEALILELSYGELARPLIDAAELAGREGRDGLEMLIGQGLAAFELWTGHQANPHSVRSAIR